MKRFAFTLLACLPAAAFADSCTDINEPAARLACYDRLTRCVAVADGSARLACFDAGYRTEPSRIPPQPELTTAPEPERAEPAVTPQKKQHDDEAFPLPAAPRDDDAPRIVARIMSVQADGRGRTYLTLDNDQVWREVEPARWQYSAGDAVEITRGLLGSTNLKAEGMSKYVKVKRVR
ncbi:MAG: hypothetical protein R3E86_21165 [Pseudomonadales bacterium]